jgi:hypothetical protein
VIRVPVVNPTHRVRVMFGEHCIARYKADQASAERYASAMARRFAGLNVMLGPLSELTADDMPADPLPSEQLWSIPPK